MSAQKSAPSGAPPSASSGDDLNWMMRALVVIERTGNRLPHPFWLFLLLAGLVMLTSAIMSAANVVVTNPADGETVTVTNLFSNDALREIVGGVTGNFVNFPPFGIVIVVLLGVAVAEYSGLLDSMLRGSLAGVPPKWITFFVALVGCAAVLAGDGAFMLVIPLGGLAFKAVGRNPILGVVVAYAASSGGFSASPMVGIFDALLGGISTTAAQIIDPEYVVTPVANLYFNMASMLVVAGAVTLVTELLLAKRADQMIETLDDDVEFDVSMKLEPREKRGVLIACLALLGYFATLFLLSLPSDSFLRDTEGGFSLESGLMEGIGGIIGLAFAFMGIVYGVITGSIKRFADVPGMMTKGVEPFVPVIILFFAASQFLALFNLSNVGLVVAITGADVFKSFDTAPFVVLLFAAFLVALGALFVTSGSALWTLMAPILIPMLMLLGIAPEVTQALYRIGDSTMNIMSPMSPYFIVALGFLQRYRKDSGIGTLLSFTIPLSIGMFTLWAILFFAWWFVGIPFGPGSATEYQLN